MKYGMVCMGLLFVCWGLGYAEEDVLKNPVLIQAFLAQQERDFEKAQTLFDQYIADLTEAEQALYKDISRIAPLADVRLCQQAEAGERKVMLDRFWNRVDPSPLTRANERQLEHYRRVAYARAHFGQGQFPWDDRGEVYVRFGAPDHVGMSGDIQIEQDRDVQDARQNFVNKKRVSLAVRPGQPIFPVPDVTRWAYWVYVHLDEGTEFTFVSRFKRSVYEFASVPEGLDVSLTSDLMAYQGQVILRDISSRKPSIYQVDFADLPIDFFYYPASFRGIDNQTRLEIYYGLPASEMARLPVNEKTDRIMMDRGVALFDSTWVAVARISDQLTFDTPSEQQVLEGAFVPGVLSFDRHPGLHYLAFQVRDVVSGKSQVYQQELRLADYSGRDQLLMSDIELAFWVAPTQESGPFVKRGLKVIPMASKSFRKNQNAFVFFEIYNLNRDNFGQTKYRVDYLFRTHEKGAVPVKILRGVGRFLRVKDKTKEIEISYEQTGDVADDMAYVELDLQDVEPGQQLVRIDVTDLLTNQSVHKEIVFGIDP
jgi:GWxTD domain-containing protein